MRKEKLDSANFLILLFVLAIKICNGLIQPKDDSPHRFEMLDRNQSTTKIQETTTLIIQPPSTLASPTFYTREDGYIIRHMKAIPKIQKLDQPNSDKKPNPVLKITPSQSEPSSVILPIRPTITIGKPSNGMMPDVPSRTTGNINNNSSTGKPIKTNSPIQPTNRKRNNNNDDDDTDGEDDEDKKKPSSRKKNPTESQAPAAPINTTTNPWGDYLLPTRSAQPRWMRNSAAKGKRPVPAIILFASLIMLILI